MNPKILTVSFTLTILVFVLPAQAQSEVSEVRLRDGLLRHFQLDNLVPIFLPRQQEVGDVLDATGAVHAKRSECFPTLKLAARRQSDTLKEVQVDLKAEGNFGVGLKSIAQFLFSAKAETSSTLKLTFRDQEYVLATTTELRKAFSKAKCPYLADMVEGKAINAANLGRPLMILQEVFYAKKRAFVTVAKGGDAKAVLEGIKTNIGTASASLEVKGSSGNGVVVEAAESVPIAARIAFVPLPVTNVTLGGGGGPPTVVKYYWQPSDDSPEDTRKAMEVLGESIASATSGKANPLASE